MATTEDVMGKKKAIEDEVGEDKDADFEALFETGPSSPCPSKVDELARKRSLIAAMKLPALSDSDIPNVHRKMIRQNNQMREYTSMADANSLHWQAQCKLWHAIAQRAHARESTAREAVEVVKMHAYTDRTLFKHLLVSMPDEMQNRPGVREVVGQLDAHEMKEVELGDETGSLQVEDLTLRDYVDIMERRVEAASEGAQGARVAEVELRSEVVQRDTRIAELEGLLCERGAVDVVAADARVHLRHVREREATIAAHMTKMQHQQTTINEQAATISQRDSIMAAQVSALGELFRLFNTTKRLLRNYHHQLHAWAPQVSQENIDVKKWENLNKQYIVLRKLTAREYVPKSDEAAGGKDEATKRLARDMLVHVCGNSDDKEDGDGFWQAFQMSYSEALERNEVVQAADGGADFTRYDDWAKMKRLLEDEVESMTVEQSCAFVQFFS